MASSLSIARIILTCSSACNVLFEYSSAAVSARPSFGHNLVMLLTLLILSRSCLQVWI